MNILRELYEKDFKALYQGDFQPDTRNVALHERLTAYYDATPDEVDNVVAKEHWRSFTRWCADNGYSAEEVTAAKRHGQHR